MLSLGGLDARKPSNPYKFQFMEEMECHYESSIT